MTESDRELLELAARAHGGLERVGTFGWIHVDSRGQRGAWWSPLTDDGDALRLAVKLRLGIDHNHPADQQRWVIAERSGCEGCYGPVSCVEDDFENESNRNAATRRAIVRAAAAIARATHKEQT